MERNLRNGLLEAIREGRLFDWLYDNGWKLDREDLATIARELAFQLDDEANLDVGEKDSESASRILRIAKRNLLENVSERIEENE